MLIILGDNMNNKIKLVPIGITVLLIFFTGIQSITAVGSLDTELQITNIQGGFASVTMDIENIGDVTAEDIESSILVTGGILGRINVYHECTGCASCGTTLEPGAIKTETTKEAGLILGIGPIDIELTAGATNAPAVTETASGFVIGMFVIIQ